MIIVYRNPFDEREVDRYDIDAPISVADWLEASEIEFTHPFICRFNGNYLLRSDWARLIKPTDSVEFLPVPQGQIIPIILALTAIGLSLLSFALIPSPPAAGAKSKSSYTLEGFGNQAKYREPIQVQYGRIKQYPAYAAQPYTQFDSHEQYSYQLFCLGHGSFYVDGYLEGGEVEPGGVFIEDTPIDVYVEADYELYGPGEPPVLFAANVVTSSEVDDIELYGTDQSNYDEWSGPYSANPPGSNAWMIEVDLVLPNGLYSADADLDAKTVAVKFEYRRINDLGDAIGPWIEFIDWAYTAETRNPRRFTLTSRVLFPGRFEVRGHRTTKYGDYKVTANLKWTALRARTLYRPNYGDVTLLAFTARASNQLNDKSSKQINVISTRKIPVWDGTTWATQPSRSIVWAIADVFRNSEYGGGVDDSYLDLETMLALDAELDAEGRYFDGIFEDTDGVWDIARKIGRVGRVTPVLRGSQITLVRDLPEETPSAVFGPGNIVKDSLVWTVEFPSLADHDSVEVEYMDPVEWKTKTIVCALPGYTTDNPLKLELLGCTNRTVAYREGMYEASRQALQREAVKFTTGLEGYLPTYGALIGVSHDVPDWGQSGRILDKDSLLLTVDNELTWEAGETHYIMIRDSATGEGIGPIQVTQSGSFGLTLAEDLPGGATLHLDGAHDYPIFQFGVGVNHSKLFKIADLSTTGEGEVEIQAVEYLPEIYDYDSAGPPGGTYTGVVSDIEVFVGDSPLDFVRVTWTPPEDGRFYVVERRVDGGEWERVEMTADDELYLTPGSQYAGWIDDEELELRIAAYGGLLDGLGPSIEWDGVAQEASPGSSYTGEVDNIDVVLGTLSSVRVSWDSPADSAFVVIQTSDLGAEATSSAGDGESPEGRVDLRLVGKGADGNNWSLVIEAGTGDTGADTASVDEGAKEIIVVVDSSGDSETLGDPRDLTAAALQSALEEASSSDPVSDHVEVVGEIVSGTIPLGTYAFSGGADATGWAEYGPSYDELEYLTPGTTYDPLARADRLGIRISAFNSALGLGPWVEWDGEWVDISEE